MKSTKRRVMALAWACGGAVSLCAGVASGQTATMPPHSTVFTGSTRGYWFTAPTDFRITGVHVLQNPATTNAFMNWAVVRFDNNTPPPTFSAVTNAFVQLGFGLNENAANFTPVSIEVHTGEVIGVYGNTMATSGATTGANSYTATGTPSTTTIFGQNVTLNRSGMQFHLGSATSPQGMHDLWSEPTSTAVSRTEFTYEPIGVVGACCKPDGTCISTSQNFCTTGLGGTYQGDNVQCINVTCPQPPAGACCFASGACTDLSTFACTAQGGVWQGAGNLCATVSCPQPGACCFVDGTCSNGLQPAACTAQGGAFQGPSTTCATVTCPIIPPTSTPVSLTPCGTTTVAGNLSAGGIVWYSFTLSSAIATPAYLDIDTEGTALTPTNDTEIGLYNATGGLVTTDDNDGSNNLSQLSYGNTSPRPAFGNSLTYNGRDGSLAAGTYYLAIAGFNSTFATTRWGVASPSTNVGPYQIRITTCGDVPTGACCKTDGTCATLTQFACVTTNGGVYQGDGAACGAMPCPAFGACCKADGSCTAMFAPACAAALGVHQGAGTTCATVTCPVAPQIYCNDPFDLQGTSLSGVAAPAGYQWSEVANNTGETTISNTNAGYLSDTAQGARLADDFTVTGAGWNVQYLKLPVYETSSGTTTASVTGATLQIWNGPPNAGGTVVWGDTSTNRLAALQRANIYRIFNTVVPATCGGTATATGTTRPLWNAYILVGTTLPPGTYWADWGFTGSASFTGPWNPPTNGVGNRTPNGGASNALQFFTGAWTPVTDIGQGCTPPVVNQDMRFCILGVVPAACYPNCDGSTTAPCLNVQDFGCFLNAFAGGDTYANCDNSTTPPVLNVQDFSCFLNSFASGCSNC